MGFPLKYNRRNEDMPSGKVKDCNILERRAQPDPTWLIPNIFRRDNLLGEFNAGSWLFWMFRNSRFFRSSSKARKVSVLSKISSVVRFVNPMGKVSAIRKRRREIRWFTHAKSSLFIMETKRDSRIAVGGKPFRFECRAREICANAEFWLC